MASLNEVMQAAARAKEALLAKPNVVGVGTGFCVVDEQMTDEICIVVMVCDKIAPAGLPSAAMVPRQVDDIRVDVRQVGLLRAYQGRRDRWRPMPGGISIGHYQISAGTLGVAVRDRQMGQRLILSNNHVLANSNNAQPGDAILQPGGADGGQLGIDTVAYLERFCPIDFGMQPGECGWANAWVHLGNAGAILLGSPYRFQAYQEHPEAMNVVDAAVARPIDDADLLDEILEIGQVAGTTEASLGMSVRKSGRTTGFTTGMITILDATVEVNYGLNRIAHFDHQIVTGAMSQGGDSGSLLVSGDSQQAVGLLFAGSDQTTLFNPIQAVLDCLEVEI